jgi:hypothetical protein
LYYQTVPISSDRIKAALKEHNITITKNLSAADLLLSHIHMDGETNDGENINHNYMFNHLWNFDSIEKGCEEVDDYVKKIKEVMNWPELFMIVKLRKDL